MQYSEDVNDSSSGSNTLIFIYMNYYQTLKTVLEFNLIIN